MKNKCKNCGLNPNYMQSKEQQNFEIEYIKENGQCNACDNEEEGTILENEK